MKRSLLLMAAVLMACSGLPAFAGGLTEVSDGKTVCMVNNSFMGAPQIPVTVGAATYYGCCQGCVKKIQEDDGGVRHAVDPQSGRAVDKASAVMAKDAMGRVFYFEDRESLRKFNGEPPGR